MHAAATSPTSAARPGNADCEHDLESDPSRWCARTKKGPLCVAVGLTSVQSDASTPGCTKTIDESGAGVVGAEVVGAAVVGSGVVGAGVAGAGVVGFGVVGAGVAGSGVVGTGVVGAGVVGAGVVGAGVDGAGVVGATPATQDDRVTPVVQLLDV